MIAILEVKDLVIKFKSQGNIVYAVNNLSFKVYGNEILGIIGESGCGKTVTCRAILRVKNLPEEQVALG